MEFSNIGELLASKVGQPVMLLGNDSGKVKLSYKQADINDHPGNVVQIVHVGDDYFAVTKMDAHDNPVVFPLDNILKVKL